jgi:PKD repeat protein
MRLFFMPSDHVYGQWDMHETLPSQYWRYNFQDNIQYPSCAGLSAKFITTIKVYSSPESDWTLELDGRDIGGVNYTIAKPFLEEAIACQFGSDHKATYTDSQGRVWEGMPLWFFAGFVDDADQHSANAYNETKALAGYNIVITGKDGYTTTISSKDEIRSSNYLIANSLNGTHIAEEDESWPLRLVGQNVSGQNVVKKVASINLTPQTPVGPVVPTVSLVPITSNLPIGQNTQYQLVMNSLPDGLSGYDLVITLADSNIGKIVNITYPAWAGLYNTGTLPANSVKISAVDVNKMIQSGSSNTVIALVTVRGDAPGSSPITISSVHMDADGGGLVNPAIINGQVNVYSPIVGDFNANKTSGMASANVSLVIAYTDLSTGNPMPTSWLWNFGNGISSTQSNPIARYNAPGLYTVNLTVSNAYTQATNTKQNYINVTPFVKPFPGYTNLPTDTNGDYLMEDINGNGRLDYDDVVTYYQNMDWISAQYDVGVAPYDYNHNGRIDYDDVVLLYWIVLG